MYSLPKELHKAKKNSISYKITDKKTFIERVL